MVERIIQFSIKNKFIVGLLILAITGLGIYSLTQLPVDAIPDITNNQVQIISLAPLPGSPGSREFYHRAD